jgi:hypothetical protein
VPDFETHSPPGPGRFERILASTVAASRRLGPITAGLLRSINRHRRATGLVVFCVVLLSAGVTGIVVKRQAFAPEPWPPECSAYGSETGNCPFFSSDEGSCWDVDTDATSEKALTYISKDVDAGSHCSYGCRSFTVQVTFYHSSEDGVFEGGSFAMSCTQGDVVSIAYSPHSLQC